MNKLGYLATLLAFAFRENRSLYLAVALAVLSVVLELAAMTSLLPLAVVASGQPIPEDAFIVRGLMLAGIRADGRTLLLAFVGIFGLRVVTQLASQGLTAYVSKRLLAQLATRAFWALVKRVPLRDVEKETIGSFITLVGDESFRASNIVLYLTQSLALALLAAMYYTAIWVYSPATAIAVLVFLALSFLALFESFRISHRLGTRQVEQSQAASSLFLDALNGLRSVRAFSAEEYVTNSYLAQMLDYVRTLFKIELTSLLTRLGPALLLLAAVGVVAMWPAVGQRFSLDLPLIATLVVFLMRFFPVVGQALNMLLRIVADTKAARDVTRLIREYPSLTDDVGRPAIGPIQHVEARALAFEHVPDNPVLREFGVRLERGKSYALMGLSGSGKSTLLDLMLGFYPVGKGMLLVNGLAITDVAIAELRRRILVVTQDPTIFNDTVANNIRFGATASDADVERAARIAGIDDFIATLPHGYQTLIAYRGANLSGGQRQRIGIARAVLRSPDVLLLDESTSALDADTRETVVNNLLTEWRDRIILFVTHDTFVASRISEVLDMAELNRAIVAPDARATRAAVARERIE